MKVKVFSTQMGEREIETQATTWEGLQKDLSGEGISFNKMKAVIGETKLTLEAGGATLPTQGFTLFLMNKKTKAGLGKEFNSYKYGHLRGTVRVILTDDPSSADLFNKGKNYTTKKGDELLKLLKKYKGSVPTLDTVEEFLAAAKAAKGKKKLKAPAKPKVKAKASIPKVKAKAVAPKKKVADIGGAQIPEKKKVVIGKNDLPDPKVGFGKGGDNVIEKAKKAVADMDVVKEENISDGTLKDMDDALALLYNFDVSEIDHMIHEDIQALTTRLEGKRGDLLKIIKAVAEKALKEKEEAEAKENERLAAEQEAEEARVAQEKIDDEAREKEEVSEKAMRDMRDMFSDVK